MARSDITIKVDVADFKDSIRVWRCEYGDGTGVIYHEDEVPETESRPFRRLGYWIPAPRSGSTVIRNQPLPPAEVEAHARGLADRIGINEYAGGHRKETA